MRLIPKQFENIIKKIAGLETKSEDNKKYLDARHSMFNEYELGFPIFDEVSDRDVYGDIRRLKELRSVISNVIIVKNPNSDIIELGSEFKLEGRDCIFTLVENPYGLSSDSEHKYITLDSPFGKAILGKEAGEYITYIVEGKNRTMTKRISEIIKEEDYELEQNDGPVLKK